MKTLQIEFSDDDARRLERAAQAGKAESLSTFARDAIMEKVIYNERGANGHFPNRPHPSAFRRQEVDR